MNSASALCRGAVSPDGKVEIRNFIRFEVCPRTPHPVSPAIGHIALRLFTGLSPALTLPSSKARPASSPLCVLSSWHRADIRNSCGISEPVAELWNLFMVSVVKCMFSSSYVKARSLSRGCPSEAHPSPFPLRVSLSHPETHRPEVLASPLGAPQPCRWVCTWNLGPSLVGSF